MKSIAKGGPSDRRIVKGLFEWREDYTSKFEHFIESLASAQDDYNRLTYQLSMASMPFDIAIAWSEFIQQRSAYLGLIVSETLGDGKRWLLMTPRAE